MALTSILALLRQNKRAVASPVAFPVESPTPPAVQSQLSSSNYQEETFFTKTTSGDVVFQYGSTFDRITDEYDTYYGRFPKKQYEQGKAQLRETGHCNISGYDCTLEIKRMNGLFEIFFNSQNSGIVFSRGNLEGFF